MQLSTTVRNAQADVFESTVSTGPLLKIYSGAVPADCAAADPAGLLVTLTLPSDWLSNASSGAKALSGTWSGTVASSGTAVTWRIKDSGDTTCHAQGPISELGLSSVALVAGDVVTQTAFGFAMGNA